jgi:hypothetical protein
MERLFELSQEYEKLHPNSESPRTWLMLFSIEELIVMLENADGRRIDVLITDSPEVNGGGELIYIEN